MVGVRVGELGSAANRLELERGEARPQRLLALHGLGEQRVLELEFARLRFFLQLFDLGEGLRISKKMKQLYFLLFGELFFCNKVNVCIKQVM